VHNLSFGQKKRVCIAGVLAMEPELLILDEPMAGLDHAMQAELLAVLDDLHTRGITLLLATHDIDFAYRWAERIHLMADGRCAASLNAPELGKHAAALAEIGLPLPEIIGLHCMLLAHGLLPDAAAPRCVADLLAMLATSNHAKESHANLP
jgi:cobalt/nickel transport system ATP-binding protein